MTSNLPAYILTAILPAVVFDFSLLTMTLTDKLLEGTMTFIFSFSDLQMTKKRLEFENIQLKERNELINQELEQLKQQTKSKSPTSMIYHLSLNQTIRCQTQTRKAKISITSYI